MRLGPYGFSCGVRTRSTQEAEGAARNHHGRRCRCWCRSEGRHAMRTDVFYSVREYRGRKGEPKGIGWRDLLVRAHIQLGGPIVLVWDNLRMRLVEPMRRFIADHADRLTVFQLPSHSPDLNPQEGIRSLVKRDIGNIAAADLGQITRAVKRRLKQIQYRPDLVDGCLAGTGLVTDG
nr:transposase [Streptomyces sp. AK010]